VGLGFECEQGKDCQQRADAADEKHLLLSHARTLPRREDNERAD
jgi:hypothetical protein